MRCDKRCFLALTLVLFTGCGSDSPTDNDEDPEPTYPDIPGLVAFYEFDGDLENQVSDAHHGTAIEDPSHVSDRAGTPGAALYLDTPDGVLVAHHSALDLTNQLTLAAWINPEPNNRAYNAIIDKHYDEAYSLGLSGSADPGLENIRAYITDRTAWANDAVSVGSGTWVHIAFTYDDPSGDYAFYVNGASVKTGVLDHDLGTSTADLRIGRSFFGDPYKGAMDKVAIFNRSLTPAEIQALYAYN